MTTTPSPRTHSRALTRTIAYAVATTCAITPLLLSVEPTSPATPTTKPVIVAAAEGPKDLRDVLDQARVSRSTRLPVQAPPAPVAAQRAEHDRAAEQAAAAAAAAAKVTEQQQLQAKMVAARAETPAAAAKTEAVKPKPKPVAPAATSTGTTAPTAGSVASGSAQTAPSGALTPNDARALGQKMMLDMGWGMDQWDSLNSLWTKESGWRWNAANPDGGAYGIPQSLPGSKMASIAADWQTNPATQIAWGLNYIKGRYGSPNAAWAHSVALNWY